MQAKEAEDIMEGDNYLNSSVEDHINPVKNPHDPNDNADENNNSTDPLDTLKMVGKPKPVSCRGG